MKERPIIFNTEMVRAILAGRKTQTRRVCKHAIDEVGEWAGNVHPAKTSGWIAWWPDGDAGFTKKAYDYGFKCPYGTIGDRLWVRETWCPVSKGLACGMYSGNPNHGIIYKVSYEHLLPYNVGGWKPSIFMPRWASRITLEITDVRVERVHDISGLDAIAEGINPEAPYNNYGTGAIYRDTFAELWDSLNAKRGYPWELNPWVWVIEFKLIEERSKLWRS